MRELINAAKAVIERWDMPTWKDVPATAEYIARLRAAVERAENQESVGFEEWWESTGKKYWPYDYLATESAWTAAQQAERERCREIVITMGGPDVPDLLRQIDSGEE